MRSFLDPVFPMRSDPGPDPVLFRGSDPNPVFFQWSDPNPVLNRGSFKSYRVSQK